MSGGYAGSALAVRRVLEKEFGKRKSVLSTLLPPSGSGLYSTGWPGLYHGSEVDVASVHQRVPETDSKPSVLLCGSSPTLTDQGRDLLLAGTGLWGRDALFSCPVSTSLPLGPQKPFGQVPFASPACRSWVVRPHFSASLGW